LKESPPVPEDCALSDPIVGQPFAIGQSGLRDITIGSLLHEKDAEIREPSFSEQSLRYVRSAGKQINESSGVTSFCSPTATAVEVQHIQSLLPDRDTLLKIVDYYNECVLYWFGGIYHWPSFRKKLLEAYGPEQILDLQSLDWRWNALLCKSAANILHNVIELDKGQSVNRKRSRLFPKPLLPRGTSISAVVSVLTQPSRCALLGRHCMPRVSV
jgi:hypothetical protein